MITVLISCEDDDYLSHKKSGGQEGKLVAKYLNKSEYSLDRDIHQLLQNFQTKSTYHEGLDMTIMDSIAMYIANDSLESYNFELRKQGLSQDSLYNLVFSRKHEEPFKPYLLRYAVHQTGDASTGHDYTFTSIAGLGYDFGNTINVAQRKSGCGTTIRTWHRIPDGRVFEFTEGSTCQHQGQGGDDDYCVVWQTVDDVPCFPGFYEAPGGAGGGGGGTEEGDGETIDRDRDILTSPMTFSLRGVSSDKDCRELNEFTQASTLESNKTNAEVLSRMCADADGARGEDAYVGESDPRDPLDPTQVTHYPRNANNMDNGHHGTRPSPQGRVNLVVHNHVKNPARTHMIVPSLDDIVNFSYHYYFRSQQTPPNQEVEVDFIVTMHNNAVYAFRVSDPSALENFVDDWYNKPAVEKKKEIKTFKRNMEKRRSTNWGTDKR